MYKTLALIAWGRHGVLALPIQPHSDLTKPYANGSYLTLLYIPTILGILILSVISANRLGRRKVYETLSISTGLLATLMQHDSLTTKPLLSG